MSINVKGFFSTKSTYQQFTCKQQTAAVLTLSYSWFEMQQQDSGTKKNDHISPVLANLHLLLVKYGY